MCGKKELGTIPFILNRFKLRILLILAIALGGACGFVAGLMGAYLNVR